MATETLKTQIGDEIRVMTTDEIAAYKIACDEVDARAKAEADRELLKKATLAKLGLTADEALALLS
jgi:hypothetical protein